LCADFLNVLSVVLCIFLLFCFCCQFVHLCVLFFSIFFFIVPPTTEIYTLSLHDALPICRAMTTASVKPACCWPACSIFRMRPSSDRKSTRLNSSHEWISYAVFCLKKKINYKINTLKVLSYLIIGLSDLTTLITYD